MLLGTIGQEHDSPVLHGAIFIIMQTHFFACTFNSNGGVVQPLRVLLVPLLSHCGGLMPL